MANYRQQSPLQDYFPKSLLIPLIFGLLLTLAVIASKGFSDNQDIRSRAFNEPYNTTPTPTPTKCQTLWFVNASGACTETGSTYNAQSQYQCNGSGATCEQNIRTYHSTISSCFSSLAACTNYIIYPTPILPPLSCNSCAVGQACQDQGKPGHFICSSKGLYYCMPDESFCNLDSGIKDYQGCSSLGYKCFRECVHIRDGCSPGLWTSCTCVPNVIL